MNILFCNITYLNKYIGITDEDMPNKGGKWVEKNKDAHEQWNFLNYNGYCYGFVMNKGDQFSIERINEDAKKNDTVDDVTVVWCALNDNNETVIVGWYENATVYRYYQNSVVTPAFGIDRWFFTKAKAENCYLLPETSRNFVIGRASVEGKGKGFGQQNYWYAESSYAREELIPQVVDFLNEHKHERINRIDSAFSVPENLYEPLSESEINKANEYFDNSEYFDYLPYGYRMFESTKNADHAYNIATALAALHQYESAVNWFKKVVEIEGDSWETNSQFPYLYQQCEMYEESIKAAEKLFKYKEATEENVRHEIFGIIADNNYYLDRIQEGIEWLNKILAESKDDILLKHTSSVKEEWRSHIQ